MASVDDIRAEEAYLRWDPDDDAVLLVRPEKRNWTRKNYQMDLRYIEAVAESAPRKQFTVRADFSRMRLWHLDWAFLRTLIDGLGRRIKNRVLGFVIVSATAPAWFAHWMLKNRFPVGVKNKLTWE